MLNYNEEYGRDVKYVSDVLLLESRDSHFV